MPPGPAIVSDMLIGMFRRLTMRMMTPALEKRATRAAVVSFLSVALLQSCAGDGGGSSDAGKHSVSGPPLRLQNLRLDLSENDLANSHDFAYFEPGHFGEKTQYMGKVADEFGGAYAVHCRKGKPFNIEVKYQGTGIQSANAMKIVHRLLPPNTGDLVEHDEDDLKKMDAAQPAEFFYFKNGPRCELIYANGSSTSVVQVNVWTREG